MSVSDFARAIDLASMAFVFGATTWFFFIQSPQLLQRMGRERFVPVQMQLTRLLFRVLTMSLLTASVATLVHSPSDPAAMISVCVAAAGGLTNQFLIVPRALRAGGRSVADVRGRDEEGTTAAFASQGAGARTQTLHRLVVLFVAIMLGGVIAHGAILLSR